MTVRSALCRATLLVTLCSLSHSAVTTAESASIFVQALDDSGQPVSGAGMSLSAGENWVDLGSTDADGRVAGTLPGNAATWQVQGVVEDRVIATPLMSSLEHSAVARFAPVTSLTVTVLGVDGQPVEGMGVRAWPLHPWEMPAGLAALAGGRDARGHTDAHGRVTFDRMALAPTRVQATQTGETSVGWDGRGWNYLEDVGEQTTVDLREASREVTLRLREFTVGGTVRVHGPGTPVASAEVVWAWRDPQRLNEPPQASFYGAEPVIHVSGEVYRAVTDADGRFMLAGTRDLLQGGLRICAAGYQPLDKGYADVLVSTGSGHQGVDPSYQPGTADLVIELDPQLTLRASVRRADGIMSPTGSMALLIPQEDPNQGWRFAGRTPGHGCPSGWQDGSLEWSFGLPTFAGQSVPAIFMLVAPAGDIASAETTLTQGQGGVIDFGTMTLGPGHIVSGRIADQSGAPVAGATVRWEQPWQDRADESWDTGAINWRVETNAEGRFRLTGIPTGRWHFFSEENRHLPASAEMTVPCEASLELTMPTFDLADAVFRLSPAREGVEVKLINLADQSRVVAQERTDINGEVHFCDLDPGSYCIRVTHPDNAGQEMGVDSYHVGREDAFFRVSLDGWL